MFRITGKKNTTLPHKQKETGDARPFIAMQDVWKAGADFAVVEDACAPERIETIREDCGCRLIIDEKAWQEIRTMEPLKGFRKADDQ